ncbi:MAG: response regulator [Phaeodactylibacter sp.]|nr:response regulator [Phaeodactylibacter sp.]
MLPTILSFLFAQPQALRFDRLTIEDGLPDPSVLDIAQDKKGFIWLATPSGIVRYDGYEMRYYYPSDGSGSGDFPQQEYPRLYVDKNGGIWLGLIRQQARLFKYDPQRDAFRPCLYQPWRKEQLIPYVINTMIEDNRGRLLVGTLDGGLYAVDIQKEAGGHSPEAALDTHFVHNPGDPSSLPSDLNGPMAEDGEGHIWIPTNDGLYRFDPGSDSFERFQPAPGAPACDTCANFLHSAYWLGGNELWVGSKRKGLLAFGLQGQAFRQFHEEGKSVGRIARKKNGQYWISINQEDGYGHVLSVFDSQAGRDEFVYNQNYPLKDGRITQVMALLSDHSGNLWAGSWQNGVFQYNAEKNHFHYFRPGYGQHKGSWDTRAELVIVDNRGWLWIGALEEGLLCWDRQNSIFRSFQHQPGVVNSLSSNRISGLAKGEGDYLWVGTLKGIDRLHIPSGSVRRFQPFPQQNIYSEAGFMAFRSRQGTIWIYAWGQGLCRIVNESEGSFLCYPAEGTQSIPNWANSIVTIAEDTQGMLWLGQNQDGLYRFDPATGEAEDMELDFGVYDIHFGSKGNLWLATHSSGLRLFDPAARSLAPLEEKLHRALGQVWKMVADENGTLWLYSANGLIQFDPVERRIIRKFNRSIWMSPDEPWYGGRVLTRGASGELFFPSPGGVLYFHPDSIRVDTVPPRLALTDFQLFGKSLVPHPDSLLKQSISYTKKLVLQHWQDEFTLSFAALHFKSPEENRYSYKLEGYGRQWSPFTTERTAHYTNLSPGTYTFFLKGANSDGVESGEQQMLRIIILPPWYATWWARSLFALFVLALLYTAYRFQLSRQLARAEARRLAEMDRFKTNFFTNITHEFRTPLTLILGLAEELQEKAGEAARQGLAGIRRNGQQLLRMVNQLLALARLEADSLPVTLVQADVIPFLKGIFASFESAARQKGVDWAFQSETDSLLMDLDPEKLQSVLSNLLSNALKFTPEGGRVKCEVGAKSEIGRRKPEIGSSSHFRFPISDLLQISVSDTGIGIAEEQLPYVFDRFYSSSSPPQSPRRGEEAKGSSKQPSAANPPPLGGLGGAGIGLSLAKELAKLLDGHIEVKSRPGKGSTFTVTLPIRQSAPQREVALLPVEPYEATAESRQEDAPLFAGAEGGEQPLALVVEDNAEMAGFITGLLQEKFKVIEAPNGAEGIEQALKWGPDIVISDVMMPEMNGFELCRRLKQDERTSHIPVVLLTARADEDSRIEGLEYGADAYLTKPFGRRELLVRLEQLIALRRRLRERFGGMQDLPSEAESLYGREKEFIGRVKAIIHDHLSDAEFDVHALCRELGMARTPLHNKLKALTGRSTTEYIRTVRLQQAWKLLLQTALPISDIAYRTGFGNPNYFSTSFKKEFGLSPSRFRKKEQ